MVTEMEKRYSENTNIAVREAQASIDNCNVDDNHSLNENGFFYGGKKMVIKEIGLIEEAHGHKGTVRIRPFNGNGEAIMNAKNLYLVDQNYKVDSKEIFEARKYRRGRVLIKFKGLKWRDEIENLINLKVAVA